MASSSLQQRKKDLGRKKDKKKKSSVERKTKRKKVQQKERLKEEERLTEKERLQRRNNLKGKKTKEKGLTQTVQKDYRKKDGETKGERRQVGRKKYCCCSIT